MKNLVKLTVAFLVLWFFYNVVTHVSQSTELINRAQANEQQHITNPVPKSETTEEFKSRMDRETMPSPTPAANRHKMNEQFTLGDYSYRVTKIVTASRLGNQFVREVAGQDEKFVVVYFTIRNDSKKTQTVMADDFQIIDAQGRQFSTDSEASTALLMSGVSKDFLIRQIQPSLTKNAVTVFRVPADAINGSMTLVVPEKGLFSSGKATVAFNWKKNS
jgi:hypothetical protein